MRGVPLVDPGPELIEREQESSVLDALVDRLRDRGGTVVKSLSPEARLHPTQARQGGDVRRWVPGV